MFKNFFKKKTPKPTESSAPNLTWQPQATQALKLALKQAPVPSLMKGQVEKELKKAAEEAAQKDNRTEVTAEDLMNGLMAKLPPNLRAKAQQMAAQKMKK